MKDGLLIHADYCLTPSTILHNAALLLRDGKINAIGGYSAFFNTEAFETIEVPECIMMPGLVDTHLYGAGGYDCMHADANQDISPMSTSLAEHGVTSFLPTTQSCSRDKLIAVVSALADICDQPMPGAVPVGLSIEGPYISPQKAGAHPIEHIRDIDLEEAREIIAAGKKRIKSFTFAPEKPGAIALIELLLEHDIVPCMGHTVADEDDVRRAVDAGANRCSHLYNGMRPLEQRQLSLAGVALIDERIWVELITDGIHIHQGMIDLACRCKSKNRIIGISNSTEAAGLEDGTYKLGSKIIHVRDGRSTTGGDAEVIAGSVSFLDNNYRELRRNSHLTEQEAASCFTLNACNSIGMHDRGELKPGKRGDLMLMNQQNEVQMTIVNGRVVFDRQGLTSGIEEAGAKKGLPAPA